MPKEEIIEGLRTAVSKGESLEKAMTSFYNAGYKKEDIEAAAAAMATVQLPAFVQPTSSLQPQTFPAQQKNLPPQFTPTQPRPLIPPISSSVQNVSDYGKKPSRKGLAITIILFIMLLLLLGVLAGVILFKDELSKFFNSLFWRALF